MARRQDIDAGPAVDWGSLSRRDALRRLGLLGMSGAAAAALFTACGDDDEATPLTTAGRAVTMAATAPLTSAAATESGATAPSSSPSQGTTAPSPGPYTLTVTNGSTQTLDVLLYQRPVGLGVPDVQPLAWLTRSSSPDAQVIFEWSLDYSFVWDDTGALSPGVVFVAEETVPADPNDLSSNQVQLNYRQQEFSLEPASEPGAEVGNLYVRSSAGVPPATAAVGIGMSNAPVFALQAQPDADLVFHPSPQYWIAAGTFAAGEVLDPEQITSQAQVTFDRTHAMKAELQADGSWVVAPA